MLPTVHASGLLSATLLSFRLEFCVKVLKLDATAQPGFWQASKMKDEFIREDRCTILILSFPYDNTFVKLALKLVLFLMFGWLSFACRNATQL